jgi:hypothetical protein
VSNAWNVAVQLCFAQCKVWIVLKGLTGDVTAAMALLQLCLYAVNVAVASVARATVFCTLCRVWMLVVRWHERLGR